VSPVATDVGDSRQILGGTGEVVPPRDSAALAAAIERAVRLDARARAERGRAARARVLAEYDLPIAVARYEQLYSSLLEAESCAA
jgi:glycosyltransferase involved in cell wall biosynthesis